MGKLQDKRVLITGGTTGIGLETARLFLAEGAKVAITGQSAARVAAAGHELGAGVLALRADVTSRAEMAAAVAQVVAAFGGIDVVFANAGVAPLSPLEAIDDVHLAELLGININGVVITVQTALPHLSDKASVILTGSAVSDKALPGGSIYAATKAAVRSLARSWTQELAPRGIRVNVLSPGMTETPIFGKMGMPDAAVAGFVAQVPAGRAAQPTEMAQAALYLASAESAYMRAGNLVVDGGWSAI